MVIIVVGLATVGCVASEPKGTPTLVPTPTRLPTPTMDVSSLVIPLANSHTEMKAACKETVRIKFPSLEVPQADVSRYSLPDSRYSTFQLAEILDNGQALRLAVVFPPRENIDLQVDFRRVKMFTVKEESEKCEIWQVTHSAKVEIGNTWVGLPEQGTWVFVGDPNGQNMAPLERFRIFQVLPSGDTQPIPMQVR